MKPLDLPLESLNLPRDIWSPQPVANLAIRVAKQKTEYQFRFLVDTGAAITTIPKWLADARGLPNGCKHYYGLRGLGPPVPGYLHDYEILLCGKYPCRW